MGVIGDWYGYFALVGKTSYAQSDSIVMGTNPRPFGTPPLKRGQHGFRRQLALWVKPPVEVAPSVRPLRFYRAMGMVILHW